MYISSLQSLWFTVAVWRTLEAPRFKPAFIFVSVLGVALITLSLLIRFLELRDRKIRARTEHGFSDTEASSVRITEPEKAADGAAPQIFKGEAAATA
jgi:ACS family pantothenate transporter-like MFS transporter